HPKRPATTLNPSALDFRGLGHQGPNGWTTVVESLSEHIAACVPGVINCRTLEGPRPECRHRTIQPTRQLGGSRWYGPQTHRVIPLVPSPKRTLNDWNRRQPFRRSRDRVGQLRSSPTWMDTLSPSRVANGDRARIRPRVCLSRCPRRHYEWDRRHSS